MYRDDMRHDLQRPGDGVIRLILLAIAWVIILPISGLIDVLGNDEDSKIWGSVKLVAGLGIWMILFVLKIF